ncbi:MAG: GC-type dockerin domain-anchored protein [Planctomycetota bacterium]|nr:GC-type dockerin domain-anchored protein [Planctomycetota bacterium]
MVQKSSCGAIAWAGGIAAVSVAALFAGSASAAYDIIGSQRTGWASASVSQIGQTTSQSPTVGPSNPLGPDADWTGPSLSFGGTAPYLNVTAKARGQFRLTTTGDALTLECIADASRTLTGGLNTSSSASAGTTASVTFTINETRNVRVQLSATRVGLINAGVMQARLIDQFGVMTFAQISAPGEQSVVATLTAGTYAIAAGATANPAQNAGVLCSARIEVAGLGSGCPADFNSDGFLDFTDFDDFVGAFEAGAASADFNNDGFLDFTDFDAFVEGFEAGC